jgi:uncharacterized protein DUF3830
MADPAEHPRQIEVRVGGVAGRAVLWEELAPKTVAALIESMPIEAPLLHCKWSGRAVFASVTMPKPVQLESPVTSIYPRTLVVRPPEPGATAAELLIGYGDAEFRWPDGRRYVTPFAEILAGNEDLLAAMARTGEDGQTTLRLRLAKESK